MSGLVVRFRALVVRVAFALARRLPLRRRVVLASSHDSRLRGNLVVIEAALRTADPPIEVVALAHASRGDLPGKLRGARARAHLGSLGHRTDPELIQEARPDILPGRF